MRKIIYEGRKNVVGSAVRRERIRRGMSQQDVVAQLQVLGVNIDQQMLSRIETGNRLVTDYELALIAKVLKTSLEVLFSDFFDLTQE